MNVFMDYWPWALAILFLLAYEMVAALSQVGVGKRHATLSEMVWKASRRYPWLPYATGILMGLLFGHFFLGWWRY